MNTKYREYKVIDNFQIQEGILRRNRVTSYSKIEKGAIKKIGIIGYFKKKEKMEGANKDMSEINFLD